MTQHAQHLKRALALAKAPAKFAAKSPAKFAAAPPVKPSLVPAPPPVPAPAQVVLKQAPASVRPAAPAFKPLPVHPVAPHALPDYGGRDSITGTADIAQSSPALNPLAQAWRAFEALVIVLALIFGGLYGMKRFGLIKNDGTVSASLPVLAALPGRLKQNPSARGAAPAAGSPAPWITLIGSQVLPQAEGASLQLVSLNGKTLLLGVTAHSVSLISEVESNRQADFAPTMDTGQMPVSFDGFLTQADRSPLRQSNETELLMNATTMRLQAMISRSEAQVNGSRS